MSHKKAVNIELLDDEENIREHPRVAALKISGKRSSCEALEDERSEEAKQFRS